MARNVEDFLEGTNDCVYILDDQWRFTFLNRRAKKEIAKDGRDLIGEVIWELLPDTVSAEIERNYRRARDEGTEVTFQSYFEPLASWYEVRASPLSGGGIAVWFRNINEKVGSFASLTSAEERFRLASKATQDLIFDWDIPSGQLEWQESEGLFLGFHHTQLGTDTDWLVGQVHPDDRDLVRDSTVRALSGPNNRFVSEYRIARKDGSYAEILVRGFLTRDSAGRATRIVGAVQDNSERNTSARALQERETQLSSVFGQAMIGIMHTDHNGKALMINERFCEILGRSLDEMRSLTFVDYTHPDDLVWNGPLHDAKKIACEPFQIEKRYVRPDGTVVSCEVSVSYVRSKIDGALTAVVVAQDITARKEAESALKAQSALLQTVIDSVQDLIFVKDLEGKFVLTNKALSDGCGELVGTRGPENFAAELAEIYEGADQEVMASGKSLMIDETIPICGKARLFETVKVPWFEQQVIAGVIGVSRDITETKTAQDTLRESELLYRSVLEASADCIEVIGLDGRVRLANTPTLEALSFDRPEDVVGKRWEEFWPKHSQEDVHNALTGAGAGKIARFSSYSKIRRATPRWWDVVVSPMTDANGIITGYLSIARDTTLQRETSAKLEWASEHDALTGLPNRRAFQARLQAATIRAMETGGSVGLLLIDLDHFKHVNDTLGHTAGDHLLKVFGGRLRETLRGDDFVARLGGDEFAVIVESEEKTVDLEAMGAAVLSRLQMPVKFAGRVLEGSASLGGAVFPINAVTANELFDNADIALYALKENGRGGTKIFEQHMREQAQIVSSQLSLARASITGDAIEPYYQQKVDLTTGAIKGFEALLRWRHSRRGIQLPASVAEAFKDYDLASKISDLMQNRVFSDARSWLQQDLPLGHISVNAAPVEFLRDDFAERMIARMLKHEIPPHVIELEVTEHVFVERGMAYVARALDELHKFGIRIALDDFGTGYSSLSHLRDFPVDVVKIDRSFIDGMNSDPEIMAIVAAVISLAKSLKIDVVAEGVETEEQRLSLIAESCPYGQGYLFGRPAGAQDVLRLLGKGSKLHGPNLVNVGYSSAKNAQAGYCLDGPASKTMNQVRQMQADPCGSVR